MFFFLFLCSVQKNKKTNLKNIEMSYKKREGIVFFVFFSKNHKFIVFKKEKK